MIEVPDGFARGTIAREGVDGARWIAALPGLVGELLDRVYDAAIGTIRELGREQPDRLVHGDLHYENVVQGTREPWLAIDPKGVAGDPANSAISVVIGGYQRRLAADQLCAVLHRWLAIFADAAELDRERTLRWAQAHALLGACWERKAATPVAAPEFAERIATVLT